MERTAHKAFNYGDSSVIQITNLTKELIGDRLEELVEIEDVVYSLYHDVYSIEKWSDLHFKKELPMKWKVSQVAKVADHLVGFSIASQIYDDTIHLHRTAVLPNYSNRGLGPNLIRKVITTSQALGIKRITTDVNLLNKKSIGMCKKLGFTDLEGRELAHYLSNRNRGDVPDYAHFTRSSGEVACALCFYLD